MSDEDQATQGTPVADSDADAGHSEETIPDSGAAEDTQAGGPPEGETTEASPPEGHEADTTKPDRYGEQAYKTLQTTYTQEREARLDLERRLAAAESGKRPDQPPDERVQIQKRLEELEAQLDATPYDGATRREVTRLEARLEIMDQFDRQGQQQNFRTAREQGFTMLKEKAPVLWAAEDSEEFPKAQALSKQMEAISQRHGLKGHPHEAYLAYAVASLEQRGQEVEAAKAQGALTESKRKEKVDQQGQLGGGQRKESASSLTASQRETAKLYGLTPEKYAASLAATKGGTFDAS